MNIHAAVERILKRKNGMAPDSHVSFGVKTLKLS
jgi:hypothetical protein